VVVDGVFSTEGEWRRCQNLRSVRRYGARLMVDEAHALGVLGARGAGTAELLDVEERVDLRMPRSPSHWPRAAVIAGRRT